MAIVYLYLIELLIRPQDWFGPVMGWPTHWLIVLPGFLLGFATSSNLKTLLNSPESKILALYLFFIFVSTLLNEGFFIAKEQFMKYLKVGSIFYLLYLLLDNEKKIIKTLICLLILGVLLSQHAIQQGLTGVGWAGVTLDPNYEEIRARWLGVWDGSNGFGLLLGMTLPIGLELLFNLQNIFWRMTGLISSLMLCWGIYFTNSRGTILAVGCGFLFYTFSRWKPKHAIIIVLLLLTCAGAFLPSRMTGLSTKERSAGERSWAWEQGLNIFRKHSVIGVGKGQFIKYSEEGILSHNNYVQVFSELGVIGYFLFTSFLWFPLKRSYQLQMEAQFNTFNKLNIIRVINSSFVVFLAGTFFIVMENDMIMVLLGLVSCSTWRMMQKDQRTFEIFTQKDFLGISFCMAAIYSLIWLIAIKDII